MITIVSFQAPSDNRTGSYGVAPRDPDIDLLMDVDDDFEADGSKLTCPGEGLTSSSAFMRLVDYYLQRRYLLPDFLFQGAWYLCR